MPKPSPPRSVAGLRKHVHSPISITGKLCASRNDIRTPRFSHSLFSFIDFYLIRKYNSAVAHYNKRNLPQVIVLLFIVGFFIRVGFILFSKSYVDPHDWEYGEIARNMVAGNGYARVSQFSGDLELTSSHAPLYPYFLTLFYSFGHTTWIYIAIQLVQALLSSLTILILYEISFLLFNRIVGTVTAFGLTLYPPLIYYSAKLVPTTFFIFLLTLTLLLVLKIKNRRSFSVILAGVTLGLSLLCDPLAFALFPALIIWHFIQRETHLKDTLFVIMISCIVLVPWTVRNHDIHGRIVPVTTQFGINFWIGNNPNATGTDYYNANSIEDGSFILMTETLSKDTEERLAGMSEIERSQLFFDQGIQFIQQDPNRFLTLLFKKIYYYWWFAPPDINASIDVAQHRTIYTIFYLPMLLLGLLGIVISLLTPLIKNASLIILTMFFVSSTYTVTHVGLMRYRVPLEVYLLMFACFAIVVIADSIVKNQ